MRMFSLFCVVSAILLGPQEIQANSDNYTRKVDSVVHLVAEENVINGSTNIAGWNVKPIGVNFTCELFEQPNPANNVNELTPYDVSVVGALGDSITAAFGAGAETILQINNEYRGLSWSIGGDDDLSKVGTLPNIVKKYNPDVKGFSVKIGNAKTENAHLNVAVSGAKSRGMINQARTLVAKMKEDQAIDFENDWKIVTLWIGANDLCVSCIRRKEYSPDRYNGNIMETLDFLQENMPRTLVNVVQIVDVSRIVEVTGCGCTLFQSVLCPCSTNEARRNFITDYAVRYQEALRELLVRSGRYETKNDFAVVLQPFMEGVEVPMKDGKADKSYAAPDCFHFSTKSHALAGVALWNNMVQPVGQKATEWSLEGVLQCPTKDRPYFYTNTNSRTTLVDDNSVMYQEQKSPSTTGSSSLEVTVEAPSTTGSSSFGITVGTVIGVVFCIVLAVAILPLVAHFKKQHSFEDDEKSLLLKSKF